MLAPPPATRVPTTAAVQPGARVHIVLKADQPTGRTVSGTVQTVLTRGNHPRGIKVRLADGRVGRVQRIASEGEAVGAEGGQAQSFDAGRSSGGGRWGEEEKEVPPTVVGLDAYIKPARARRRAKRGGGARAPAGDNDGDEIETEVEGVGNIQTPLDASTAMATCPVCGAFEGDEAAVAHHVAGHFDD